MEQYSTPNVLTNHQCTIGILDVIFYNNIKSYQCHPHRGSSTNTFVSTPDISFSATFSCILGGQSMSLSVRRISTPSCFTRTSFPDESKSRFNSLQSMDNFVLVQTSPCGEVWFEIWLKAHGKFSKAHGKIEITRGAAECDFNFSVRFGKFSVRFESQISNHTSPQGDVCD